MPNDHTYGVSSQNERPTLEQIIKYKFGNDEKPELLLNVEKTYKPQYLKNRLKPPKPTNTSNLRREKNGRSETPTLPLATQT